MLGKIPIDWYVTTYENFALKKIYNGCKKIFFWQNNSLIHCAVSFFIAFINPQP